jgi:hypothetical protein
MATKGYQICEDVKMYENLKIQIDVERCTSGIFRCNLNHQLSEKGNQTSKTNIGRTSTQCSDVVIQKYNFYKINHSLLWWIIKRTL